MPRILPLPISAIQKGILSADEDYLGDTYRDEFRRSIENPTEYWGKIAENTVWTKKFNKVLDDSQSPFTKWFPGGKLSLCYNAVDRHVDEGRGNQTAIIWDSAITTNRKKITYSQLQEQVRRPRGTF